MAIKKNKSRLGEKYHDYPKRSCNDIKLNINNDLNMTKKWF